MTALNRLNKVLEDISPLAVAVSGGVDSMTLAYAAHHHLPGQVAVFHAVSPAVPPDATRRVRSYADMEGWALSVIGTDEFDDPNYRHNPVNRCFYCKTHLYETIASMTSDQVISGTNLDDLGDFRPGLSAAKSFGVRHPFVEAAVDKSTVRTLARQFGLDDLAELPSAPCLSSRIETGITIESDVLSLVDRAEKLVAARTAASTARVRVRSEGIVIEMDRGSLVNANAGLLSKLAREVGTLFLVAGHPYSVRVSEYKRGSAFLRSEKSGSML